MIVTSLRKLFEETAIAAPGESIMVAFSGGPDSTALLHALLTIREELDFSISAAHLNHGLRGSESDADQLFCHSFCKELDIPFLSRKVDLKRQIEESGDNMEELAREVRYQFLQEAAKELEANLIATAHTADDQIETVVQRLIRGSGMAGLSGIPLRRGNIIRPLLTVERKDVETYLKKHSLPSRHDSHNDDPGFTRVFIRKEITPRLKQLNESLADTISNNAAIWAMENDFLEEIAEEITQSIIISNSDEGYSVPVDMLLQQHPAMQQRIIRRIFIRLLGDTRGLESRHITTILEHASDNAPGVVIRNIAIQNDGSTLNFNTQDSKEAKSYPTYEYRANAPCTVSVDGLEKSFTFSIFEKTDSFSIQQFCGPSVAALDADKTGRQITIRSWQEGDKYRQSGSGGTQKLQDIFVNAKLSGREKHSHPVFLAENGIIWVYGFRVSEDHKVSADTKSVLLIEEEDRDETSH